MKRSFEFWFDIVSPASYIAWTQVPRLVQETGAAVMYRPFFLPGIFKDTGNSSPITVPAKGKWMFRDLRRFAKRYDIPFWMNDRFPMSSLHAMRGLIAWQEKPELRGLGDGFYAAMWVDNRDINDPQVVAEIVTKAGIDPAAWKAAIEDPQVKQRVFDITAEGVRRGVFGAPTFFVIRDGKEEMHWGQDRMDFVREALLEA